MSPEPDVAALRRAIPVHAQRKLDHILAEIVPWDDSHGLARAGPASWQIRLADPPIAPWMTLFILRDVLGCRDLGHHEKLRYEVPLVFEGTPMTIAYEKFGTRTYVGNDDVADGVAAEALAREVLERLARAAPIIEKHMLAPIASAQLKAGRITIDNQFFTFRDRYEHFRARAVTEGKASTSSTELPSSGTPGSSLWSYRSDQYRRAKYDVDASVVAFFSLLEHVLVYGLACARYDPSTDNLEEFVQADWAKKFRRVVDLTDPSAKRQYDALRLLAATVRNPSAHAGFDREQSRFHFHLPGVGAVRSRLSRRASSGAEATWWANSSAPGESVWPILDAALDWITRGPLHFAWQLCDSGLDLSYEAASVAELRLAIEADLGRIESFSEYIDRLTHLDAIHTNMDY